MRRAKRQPKETSQGKERAKIFLDPLTEASLEGEAVLVKCLNENLGEYDDRLLQLWEVRFDKERDTVVRKVLRTNPGAGAREYQILKAESFDDYLRKAKALWGEKLSLRNLEDRDDFLKLKKHFDERKMVKVRILGATFHGWLGMSTGFVPFFVLLLNEKSDCGMALWNFELV